MEKKIDPYLMLRQEINLGKTVRDPDVKKYLENIENIP